MDTIVIAKTKAEGEKRFPSAVAVVTPRSPDGARGKKAHRIVVLTSMDSHPDTQKLIEACKPCLVFKSLEGVVAEDAEASADLEALKAAAAASAPDAVAGFGGSIPDVADETETLV